MKELDALHGLTLEAARGRHKCRITLKRQKKFVGKRITIYLLTNDPEIAMFARDAILQFCQKIGLCVVRRAQKRPAMGEEGA